MSSTKCDFCGSTDYEEVYKPIKTKRNNRVCVCNSCGLVFSVHDDIAYSREPNPSGDADWGNIRFCKTQRFGAIKDQLPLDAKTILDVGSNRGHFVRWMRDENPKAQITAIEPDTRISSVPKGVKFYGQRLEDVELEPNQFDFVYCVQTLEHSDSASAMLRQMYDVLKPGGRLFLEVPNLEVIRYPDNIEEFFIDKHNFHFSREALVPFMQSVGYHMEHENSDNLNVRVVASKSTPRYFNATADPVYVKRLLCEYERNIQKNRAKLPNVVEQINRLLEGQRVAFWGANVLMDLMVKYGDLDPQKVECLVDDFLWEYLPSLHGIPIHQPTTLRAFQPETCVVLARFGADIVAKKARQFGIRNVVKFYDLMRAA